MGLNILKFGSILVASVFIAPRIGKLADTALSRIANISNLGIFAYPPKRYISAIDRTFIFSKLRSRALPFLCEFLDNVCIGKI